MRRQSLEGFPETRVSRIPNPESAIPNSESQSIETIGQTWGPETRWTTLISAACDTICSPLYHHSPPTPTLPRASQWASHICSPIGDCRVCVEGGPGLSPLNNRIKNDNPKIRRHQRSPASDCRPKLRELAAPEPNKLREPKDPMKRTREECEL